MTAKPSRGLSYAPVASSAPPSAPSSSQSQPIIIQGMAPPAYQYSAESGNSSNVEEDFKWGVSVANSDPSIRMAFVRKVYLLLSLQVGFTALVGGVMMFSEGYKGWLQANPWAIYLAVFGSLASLLALYWKRRSHPTNLFLLFSFTAMEAFTIGSVVAFSDRTSVLHALLLTLASFLGLTMFTLQSTRDFSGMAPYLHACLMLVFATFLLHYFIPFSSSLELVMSVGTAALFAAYVVHDTYNIFNRLSPEEHIVAAVDLYLDVINLFLQVLRVVQDLRS